jgi:hypothetical protein
VISLRIAGFSEDEIAELVQKGGGNAALGSPSAIFAAE